MLIKHLSQHYVQNDLESEDQRHHLNLVKLSSFSGKTIRSGSDDTEIRYLIPSLLTASWLWLHYMVSLSLPLSNLKRWWKLLSCVQLFATPWTVAHQAPLSMGFSRQEYWSGLPFPSPGDLPDPGVKTRSPVLQADSLPSEAPGTDSGR